MENLTTIKSWDFFIWEKIHISTSQIEFTDTQSQENALSIIMILKADNSILKRKNSMRKENALLIIKKL